MATDIRAEVGGLPGVEAVHVELQDRMPDDQFTRGVNHGLPFQAVFEDADDGVEAVRAKLDHKARLKRQSRAVEAFLDAALDPAQVVDLTPADVDGIEIDQSTGDNRLVVSLRDGTVRPAPLCEHLEQAREVGVVWSR